MRTRIQARSFSSIWKSISLSLVVVVTAFGAAQAESGLPAEGDVVARLNGEPIYLADVESKVAFQVYRLKADIYTLLKQEAEKLVNERLLAEEAARRGITADALLQQEVEATIPPLTEADVDAYFEEHPEDAAHAEEVRPRIRTYLAERRKIERRLAFFESLRQEANFEFVLPMPERPRQELDLTGAPMRGNPDAPITLVHFASFSCSHCAESVRRIERLQQEFPDQIRWVHRNFFNIYDQLGLRTAALAFAAQEQGNFWAFHDIIYSYNGGYDTDTLAKVAADLGLGQEKSDPGSLEGRHLGRVKADIDAGVEAGVSGVPVIFVNGRYFSGTFPYEDLRALVEEELARATSGSDAQR